MRKSKSILNKKWIIIIAIIITSLIIGGVIYFWQNLKNEAVISELEKENYYKPKSIESLDYKKEFQKIVADKMINNKTINGYLINLCHYNEENCGESFFFKWKEQDGDNVIAFLSHLDEEKWKIDPFNYSVEIYIVDFKSGKVSRQSPFDGTFDYITNLEL